MRLEAGALTALNDRGMLTRGGGRWHASNLRDLLTRLEWLFRSKAPPNGERTTADN
jgi:hypothetical protein